MQIDGKLVDVWCPSRPELFTASGDPYAFLKTEHNRTSKGGGNVFMERDETIDPDYKPISEWETFRNVCTYLHRLTDPDDYAEDMLMMCVWWGAMMFPEINVPLIWDHFRRRNYHGYLKYENLPNGGYKKTPGFFAKGAYQQRIFQKHQQYIEQHGMRERHMEILLECKSIKGIEDLTNYDLFTAVGGSYIGAESDYGRRFAAIANQNYDISGYIHARQY